MLVVQFLNVFFGMLLIIGRYVLRLLDPIHRFGARMANRDTPFLRELVHDLDQLFAALFGQRRNGNPNDRPVIGRREAEIGRQNPLLDSLEQTAVPRLHRQQLGLWCRHVRHLGQRHLVAVGFDAHEVEQRRRRLAGAHGRELALHRLDGFVHQLFGMLEVIGKTASRSRSHWTIVPTRSPARTLAVAPGWLMLNTTMGSLFSLHNPKALASITAYPFTSAS